MKNDWHEVFASREKLPSSLKEDPFDLPFGSTLRCFGVNNKATMKTCAIDALEVFVTSRAVGKPTMRMRLLVSSSNNCKALFLCNS